MSNMKRALEERADKMGRAAALAFRHWHAGIRPYGDLAGDGSALLMDALGETGPTTEANHLDRLAMCDAYQWTLGALAPTMPGPCERRALELSQAAILAITGICRTCGFTHPETDCPRWPASAA